RILLTFVESANVLVRYDQDASGIGNGNHKMMRATENLPFTRQFELAALLLSGRAVLDRLLRGLVNFLWCDQYCCSGLHGPAGVDGQREGCCIHVARQIGNDYEVVAPKGIVVAFQSPTHSFQ